MHRFINCLLNRLYGFERSCILILILLVWSSFPSLADEKRHAVSSTEMKAMVQSLFPEMQVAFANQGTKYEFAYGFETTIAGTQTRKDISPLASARLGGTDNHPEEAIIFFAARARERHSVGEWAYSLVRFNRRDGGYRATVLAHIEVDDPWAHPSASLEVGDFTGRHQKELRVHLEEAAPGHGRSGSYRETLFLYEFDPPYRRLLALPVLDQDWPDADVDKPEYERKVHIEFKDLDGDKINELIAEGSQRGKDKSFEDSACTIKGRVVFKLGKDGYTPWEKPEKGVPK